MFLVAELEGLGHHGVPGELGVDGLGGQTEHLAVFDLVVVGVGGLQTIGCVCFDAVSKN